MDEVKMYFGLWLLDDRAITVTYSSYCIILVYKLSPKIGEIEKKNRRKKKREQIVFTKPVTR